MLGHNLATEYCRVKLIDSMEAVYWKRLLKCIPARIQVHRKVIFEIVWVPSFMDAAVVGETRFSPDQIALKLGESARDTVHTYAHELLHAISDTYGAGLTESQVMALEPALYYLLKPGNVFNSRSI